MSIGKSKIREDFYNVEKEIRSINYNELIDDRLILNLKHIHKISYSMCMWKAFLEISDYNDNIKLFVSEIFSTYIQIIYIMPLKDLKVIKFLERNIIDNFIKIMKIMNNIDERETDIIFNKIISLNNDKEYKNMVILIKSFYKKSSNYIHSTDKSNCSLIDSIKMYKQNSNYILDETINELFKLGKYINFIFILTFSDIYSSHMNRVNRSILMQSLDKRQREKIMDLFY